MPIDWDYEGVSYTQTDLSSTAYWDPKPVKPLKVMHERRTTALVCVHYYDADGKLQTIEDVPSRLCPEGKCTRTVTVIHEKFGGYRLGSKQVEQVGWEWDCGIHRWFTIILQTGAIGTWQYRDY